MRSENRVADRQEWTDGTERCGHCNNVSRMIVVGRYGTVKTYDGGLYDAGDLWEMLLCETCKNVSLRAGHYDDRFNEYVDWKPLYPSAPGVPTGLPDTVRSAYEEAQGVRDINPNAYAVLLGRVLDHVCSDKQAVGRTLAERLRNLAGRRVIPETLADIAHALRSFRNVGAHADLGGLSRAETSVLESLCDAVLEYVYVEPLLLKSARERLDALGRPPSRFGSLIDGC
jgi:Domain of unknown function (DUF4145)